MLLLLRHDTLLDAMMPPDAAALRALFRRCYAMLMLRAIIPCC